MNVAGLRAALRIARRDAVRAKGRSLLVVAMIGVPMLGLAFADVAYRTAQLPPAEVARREIGAADLLAERVSAGPITQYGLHDYSSEVVDKTGPEDTGAPPVLPAGSAVEPWVTYYGVNVRHGDRVTPADVERLDLTAPFAGGLLRRLSGRVPTAPSDALLTPALARDLGARIGASVTAGGATFTVTGIATDPQSLATRALYVSPDAALADEGQRTRAWAVVLPDGVDDTSLVQPLNQAGFRVSPRTWFFDPPPTPWGSSPRTDAIGVGVVVVGLATLEIVLLAGTAFAVSARRRRRDLALVAATGGDSSDVRRVVLAGGVVLGAVAGLVGVVGGVAIVAWAPLSKVSGSLRGPLDVRPLELGGIVAVAVGTALLAALLPARAAARQPVVAALTGRRGDVAIRWRVPFVALLAVAAGAALAFWAAGDGQVPAAVAAGETVVRGRPANFTLLLAGAVVAELGFVACAPALVGLVGRTASRLPLSLRLAARDAARHRTRSAPAVGAVVAAVAGSVAMSVYLSSETEHQRRAYTPTMPTGTVSLYTGEPLDAATVERVARTLPVRDTIDLYDVAPDCATFRGCGEWRPRAAPGSSPLPGRVVVASPALVTWLTGDDRAAAALGEGKVVVFDHRWLQNSALVLSDERRLDDGRTASAGEVAIPAFLAPMRQYRDAPSAVMSAETAARFHLPTVRSNTFLTTSRMPTGAELAEARGALRSRDAGLDVERGFQSTNPIALLALVAAAAFVTLGSTGIATGLAAADSRPDLATLSAVGAAPRVRRRLAMAQALTVAAMGTGLGILAGLVPSIAVVAARAEVPLRMPWNVLGAVALGVPVLAAVLVGAVTRARLPIERRLA